MMLGPDFDTNPHAAGSYMLQALLNEMGACITYNCQSLTAPPDTIWGDGSITNMIEVGSQRDTVVFAAHARVLPTIIDHSPMKSNAGLVKLAWEHLHKTWKDAEVGLVKVNSYIGGVSWRYLDENLYSVCHRLPTPYLCNYTPEDLVYFKNQIHYGVLDHSWPAECLIHTERMRLMGSSDGAFMVEITEAANNIPPVEHYHPDEADHFWRNLKHNKVNRMFSVIFRGE